MVPPWLEIAEAEIGVKEIHGPDANPRIVEYFTATSYGATSDEVAWCSAFANWCMKKAGIPGTGSAAAKSWLNWGKMLDIPVRGCVVVFDAPDPAEAWQGHVAFYYGESQSNASNVMVLGGNQGNEVKVAPYPKSRIMGYRWPN
jgi:uncharacterized protein (TIGR02594 family)